MLVLIDNYDSFSFNLFQELSKITQDSSLQLVVHRNDQISLEQVLKLNPKGIIISPGPGGPEDAGISKKLLQELSASLPILGVCLGHQVIAQVFGAKVLRSYNPRHGKTSLIEHCASGLFAGLPSPLHVARYHSLCVAKENFPQELEIQAYADDGIIMALRHKTLPIFGLQFHPESFLTEHGEGMLKNFLKFCQ